MIKYFRKISSLTILSILLLSTIAFLLPVKADTTTFSDDFSSGNFNTWTSTYGSPTISGGIATFTVSTGDGAQCYAEKDQLSISSNDVFSVSSRVRFNTIPNNGQGNSAIFFNDVIDSSNPAAASIYAFVDGSRHFGLWIGQWPNYICAYDTAIVQANTYYNVTIQLDNDNQVAKLIVNGVTKVTHAYSDYSQFQNSNHVNIIEGIAENYAWTTVQVKLDYVTVTSSISYYTITASAGAGGSISPSGSVQVAAGGNQNFTISADNGYVISQVTVNGINQGAISSYAFNNVQSNQTISASFIQNETQNIEALHVSGNQILTASNAVVVLRGVDYSYFIDGPNGSWMTPNGSIEWNTWDTTAVNANLDALQSWGVNNVRVLATVEWWTNNTDNFQNHLEYFINQAAARGMYVDFTFWRTTSSVGAPDGVLPWADGNGLISNVNDFVNLWSNVANTLKDYPNVMFEFWNEPNANGNQAAEALWFNTTQRCINSIRALDAENLIVVQWDYNLAMDYVWYQQGSLWGLEWVDQYPLSDSTGNLVYSTHIYRSSFYNWNTNDGLPYSMSDVTFALTETGVIGFDKPLWIGEIGCNLWANNMDNEYEWYNNTLTILNQNNVSYAAWSWAPWRTGTQWGLVTGDANYQTNQAGQILQAQIESNNNIGEVADLSGGQWICQAHTNVEPITTYDIPHQEGTLSASEIPNLDSCYLPDSIFRGYCRFDANGGYWNLQSTPYLSFDIWVDRTMQIEVGILDTTNGGYNPAGTLIADTYHDGAANSPPYVYGYGTGTVMSPDNNWIVMTGPSNGTTQHYTIDLRTLGVPITHLGQIVIDMTCCHQYEMNWKIHNVVLSSTG